MNMAPYAGLCYAMFPYARLLCTAFSQFDMLVHGIYFYLIHYTGTIYLFGKTKHTSGAYVSCCVAVKNIYRQIFLLPRLNVSCLLFVIQLQYILYT